MRFLSTHASVERSVIDAGQLLPRNELKTKFVSLAAHVVAATPPNAGFSHSLSAKRTSARLRRHGTDAIEVARQPRQWTLRVSAAPRGPFLV